VCISIEVRAGLTPFGTSPWWDGLGSQACRLRNALISPLRRTFSCEHAIGAFGHLLKANVAHWALFRSTRFSQGPGGMEKNQKWPSIPGAAAAGFSNV
jgi:hypothetical protein